jgi:5-methylcytosine-specific restriction endonuclease McrA
VASPYTRERLAEAAAASNTWNDMIRKLGFPVSGRRRSSIQRAAAEFGIDTSHFKQRSSWVKYSDEAIIRAVAASTSLREVAEKLGAKPATGTLSHIRRRIEASGIDVSHFPNLNRSTIEIPFTEQELAETAAASKSVREMARRLGVGDDQTTRAAIRRALNQLCIDITHFSYGRVTIHEDRLRSAVTTSTSFADVIRKSQLPVDDVNHRRVRRRVRELGLDVSHFIRRHKPISFPAQRQSVANVVFRVLPEGAPRTNRDRLHRALQEVGVPYLCSSCGNPGMWLDKPITLQIDHINGDWRDNRRENLRYLCPNCHALTDTWCRSRGGKSMGSAA